MTDPIDNPSEAPEDRSALPTCFLLPMMAATLVVGLIWWGVDLAHLINSAFSLTRSWIQAIVGPHAVKIGFTLIVLSVGVFCTAACCALHSIPAFWGYLASLSMLLSVVAVTLGLACVSEPGSIDSITQLLILCCWVGATPFILCGLRRSDTR